MVTYGLHHSLAGPVREKLRPEKQLAEANCSTCQSARRFEQVQGIHRLHRKYARAVNLHIGNALPWERCALGTICHTQRVCVFGIGVAGVTVGTARARPLPARLNDSDAQRFCIGTPRGWGQRRSTLPAARQGRMFKLPIFRAIRFKL